MTEQQASGNGSGNGNGNGNGNSVERRFSLEKIYIKDMSFEVPNAPDIYGEEQLETQVDMNLKNQHSVIHDGLYEVGLTITMHAKDRDRTVFMIELEQAGQFLITGCTDDELRRIVSTTCPATLFPYAREAISGAIGRGGFPAILLQPINFDALYASAQADSTAPQA